MKRILYAYLFILISKVALATPNIDEKSSMIWGAAIIIVIILILKERKKNAIPKTHEPSSCTPQIIPSQPQQQYQRSTSPMSQYRRYLSRSSTNPQLKQKPLKPRDSARETKKNKMLKVKIIQLLRNLEPLHKYALQIQQATKALNNLPQGDSILHDHLLMQEHYTQKLPKKLLSNAELESQIDKFSIQLKNIKNNATQINNTTITNLYEKAYEIIRECRKILFNKS